MNAEEITKNRWRGLKIISIGFIVAVIGVLLGWSDAGPFGVLLFWVGWLVGVVGMAIHFRQFYREMKAKPKDLYPPAKQPWKR